MKKILPCLALLSSMAACAGTEPAATKAAERAAPREEPEYTTASRIPRRKGNAPADLQTSTTDDARGAGAPAGASR